MSLELIKKIKESETAADKTVADAYEKSRVLLKDATDRSYKLISSSEENTEKEVKRIIAEGEMSALPECERIKNDTKKEIEAIKLSAEKKMDSAVKFIIERMSHA